MTMPRTRELVLVAVALLALLLLPLLVPPLRVLFVKPLWLDELHTWLLSRDPPGPQLVDRLARGADFNPPLLFAVDWAMLRLFPWMPAQIVLRLTSVLAMWASLVLLYRMARERLDVLPSAVGATAVLAHSILLGQVHEARFYAPWFALTVAVAWMMQSVAEHRGSWWRAAVLALLTAATCLIHYFGIVGIACLAVGFLFRERSPARVWRVAWPMALGVLALAAWLPVYAAQRTVLSVATWIAAPTLRSSAVFVLLFVAWVPYALVLAAAAFQYVRGDARGRAVVSPTIAQSAAIGLVALPFILVVFSYLVQPTLIGRYALPAVAGMACLVAIATALLPIRLQQLALAGMLLSYVALLGWKAHVAGIFQGRVFGAVAAVDAVAGDTRPVLSLERNALYTAALSAANRNHRLAYLVIPPDTIHELLRPRRLKSLDDITIVEQDGALAHHDVFGFPAVITLEQMRRLSSFHFLIAEDAGGSAFPAVFNGFQPCRVNERIVRFDARAGQVVTSQAIEHSAPCERAPAP
jgi:hypothetical protein